MAITAAQFQSVLQSLGGAGSQVFTYEQLANGANEAIAQAPITANRYGAAAFLANCTQESMYFKTTTEGQWPGYYNDKSDKDYYPYIGRGFIQVTWKENYRLFGSWCYGKQLVPSSNYFVDVPSRLAALPWAWLTGMWYFSPDYDGANWSDTSGLWGYGNSDQFLKVCNAVNRGNANYSGYPAGWAERQRAYNAWLTLGDDLVSDAPDPGTGDDGGGDPGSNLTGATIIRSIGDHLHVQESDGSQYFAIKDSAGNFWRPTNTGDISRISTEGTHLSLHLPNGSRLPAYYHGFNYWKTKSYTSGSSNGDIPDPPPSTGNVQQKLVQWCWDHINAWTYSQSSGRLNPDVSGYTDCSGTMWLCFKEVTGMDIGTWTGAQYTKGRLILDQSRTIQESALVPSDLIFYKFDPAKNTDHVFDHVVMYVGPNQTIDHRGDGPGGRGPTTHNLSYWVSRSHRVMARRYV